MLTLHKAKGTKNKVVYGTKGGSIIQSVYIDKDALGDEPPGTIQVVISAQQGHYVANWCAEASLGTRTHSGRDHIRCPKDSITGYGPPSTRLRA